MRDWGIPARDIDELNRLAGELGTPTLFVSLALAKRRFLELAQELPGVRVHYAIKSNPEPAILRLLKGLGAGFEVSSQVELKLLLSLGVGAEDIVSSHPVKIPAFVKAGWEAGMRNFAFDSADEVDKLAALAPGSQVYVRLAVSNEGSEWPLSRKFGVPGEEAVQLLCYAREKGLQACGLAFHVGSQCVRPAAWREALEAASQVWQEATSLGVPMSLLNIGGGFPVPYTKPVPALGDFTACIRETVCRLFPPDTCVVTEPGRFLVGEAGILGSTVIAKARRNGERWLYLDVGVFNGLTESLGGIRYPMVTRRQGTTSTWVLAGPSCDGFDVIASQVELPELEIGDRVFILSAGAYTTVYASTFNGFTIPRVHFVQEDHDPVFYRA